MNQEVKALWTTRLRSGQDEQGQGSLNNHGKKCCLGVLCELAAEAGVTTRHAFSEDISMKDGRFSYGPLQEVAVLPADVMEWAGLSDENPDVTVDGFDGFDFTPSLASLNDGDDISGLRPFTFDQIADVIDANF